MTTRPQRRAAMPGTRAWISRNGAVTLIACIASQSARLIRSSSLIRFSPALLTSASTAASFTPARNERTESALAPRLPALDGKVLGLLANGKVNADHLLDLVREGLEARFRVREVVARAKPSASRVADAETLRELAARCDAVVTAIGD